MTEGVWFMRLTLKREDAAVAQLICELARSDARATMTVGHRLMWAVAAPATRAAFDRDNPDRADRAAFLWREAETERKFYMLGPRPADSSDFFQVETKPFAPAFRRGDHLAFDLRLNATIARKGEPGRRSSRSDVAMDRMRAEEAAAQMAGAEIAGRAERRLNAAEGASTEWLSRVGARDGFSLQGVKLDAYRVATLPRRGRSAKIGVCDLRGALVVTDGEHFLARVLAGFGRAKAFGCGLMLLRRRP
jgi:CRISPR system Cascade subunit CasE